jgi:aminoglycoside phosphotransferase
MTSGDRKINRIFLEELNRKVISIADKSKGVDQKVSIIKTDKGVYVVKQPKTETDKIIKEIVATRLCHKKNISVPKVIFSNCNLLIETHIKGKDLDELKTTRKNFENIYFQIGKLMKRMHSIKGSSYGPVIKNKLVGKYQTYKEFIESWFPKEYARLKNTNYYYENTMKKILQHYKKNIHLISDESVLLHSDLADGNIVIDNNKVAGFIDFGDLMVGPAMQDFSYMYIYHFGDYKFDKLVEGYGKINMEELRFYTFCHMVWRLASLIEHKRFGKKFRRTEKLSLQILG